MVARNKVLLLLLLSLMSSPPAIQLVQALGGLISPRSPLIRPKVCVPATEPWTKAASSPHQALGSQHTRCQRHGHVTATTARASHHGKLRCLWSLSGFLPSYALLMQFICLDISLHRHPFFPNALHFRLYSLGFDLLH